MDIPAYGERNLARNLEENEKKIVVEPCWVGEREKVLKSWFEQVKSDLKKKKLDSRVSIDRKTVLIDRNR